MAAKYEIDEKVNIEGRIVSATSDDGSEEHTSELQSHSDISVVAVSLDRKSTRLNSSHIATSRMPYH